MPTYSFRNNDTGEEFTELMSISEREKFLEQNPNIQQLPSMFSMVGGTGDRIKNDDGWKENMSRIAEAHPHSPLAERYGNNRTIAQKKVDSVVKKHGLNKVK